MVLHWRSRLPTSAKSANGTQHSARQFIAATAVSRISRPSYRASGFAFCLLILAGVVPAAAEIKGPNGEKCATTATGVEHSKDGVGYLCDKCTVLKCDASGKELKKLHEHNLLN